MVSREDIDSDSTAVLAFDDGQRVPCDRFIMRSLCGVLARLLEDAQPASDVRGRTLIPVPGRPSAPFWVAVDVLHGGRLAWKLGLDEVLRVTECMAYLECNVHDNALDSRLWQLVRQSELAHLLPHVPRLLRSLVTAGVAARRLIQLRPLWADFRRDVLDALAPGELDGVLIDSLVAYAPNYFPPHLVLEWALGACLHMGEARAQRLASQHSVMCHPCEVPLVLRTLVDLYETRGDWCRSAGGLLRSVLTSIDKYDIAPLAAARAHGSVIKFHDVPMASVCLLMDAGRPPARGVRVTRWLTVTLRPHGLEARFRPRKIDDLSVNCSALQLRVMCAACGESSSTEPTEAWYLFDDIGGPDDDDQYTLSHASRVLGDAAGVCEALQGRGPRRLRLDFFFGRVSVLDNPFDPTSATRSAITFLLSDSTS